MLVNVAKLERKQAGNAARAHFSFSFFLYFKVTVLISVLISVC